MARFIQPVRARAGVRLAFASTKGGANLETLVGRGHIGIVETLIERVSDVTAGCTDRPRIIVWGSPEKVDAVSLLPM